MVVAWKSRVQAFNGIFQLQGWMYAFLCKNLYIPLFWNWLSICFFGCTICFWKLYTGFQCKNCIYHFCFQVFSNTMRSFITKLWMFSISCLSQRSLITNSCVCMVVYLRIFRRYIIYLANFSYFCGERKILICFVAGWYPNVWPPPRSAPGRTILVCVYDINAILFSLFFNVFYTLFSDLLWADPVDEGKDEDGSDDDDEPQEDVSTWFSYNETRQCSYLFGYGLFFRYFWSAFFGIYFLVFIYFV